MGDDLQQPHQELARLRQQVEALRAQMANLEASLSRIEQGIAPPAPARPAQPPSPPPLPPMAQRPQPVAGPVPARVVEEPSEEIVQLQAAMKQPGMAGAASIQPPRPKPAGGVSLEQRLGVSWLNKIGVVVLILGALFFFQYCWSRGWIGPAVRVAMCVLTGAAMLGLGEWTFRRSMRIFAAGVTGGGIALLYLAAYLCSLPQDRLSTQPLVPIAIVFGSMCVVTAIGVALSLRSGMVTTAVLALIGGYLTPVLLSTGQNRQVVLMTYMLVLGGGLLALSLVRRWQILGPLTLAATAILFAGWFIRYHDGAQAGRTDLFAWLFLGEFLVYCLAGKVKQRISESTGLLTAMAATLLMTILLTAQGDVMPSWGLPVHGLALAIIAMTLALLARWPALWAASLASSVILVCRWLQIPESSSFWAACWWGWPFLVIYAGYAMLAQRLRQVPAYFSMSVAGSAGLALAGLWAFLTTAQTITYPSQFLPYHLLALDICLLACCLWMRWGPVRLAGLVWTAGLVALLTERNLPTDGAGALAWSGWIWVFFGLFTLDLLVRLGRKESQADRAVGAVLSSLAMAGMFAGTYYLLNPHLHAWMGLYTVLAAALGLGLALFNRRRGDARVGAYAYLGQGLVLLILAAPIQFDKATLSLVWAAQALVGMFLARRLSSRVMVIYGCAVLALAVGHFAIVDLPTDTRLRQAMLIVGGADLRYALLLAGAICAAMFGSAALLRSGTAIFKSNFDQPAARAMVVVGLLVWLWQTAAQLPPIASGWCWLVLAAIMLALGRGRAGIFVLQAGTVLAFAAIARFFVYDTLVRRMLEGSPGGMPVLNWQMSLALAMGATALWAAFLLRKAAPLKRDLALLSPAAEVVAGLLLLWAGSFEVDRYFGWQGRQTFADPGQAFQMGLSVWWALCATLLLVAGFVARRAAVRYMALGIYGLTLLKVFIKDLAGIDPAYRIASFLALGGLLVGASLLYQRFFRSVKKAALSPQPVQAADTKPSEGPGDGA